MFRKLYGYVLHQNIYWLKLTLCSLTYHICYSILTFVYFIYIYIDFYVHIFSSKLICRLYFFRSCIRSNNKKQLHIKYGRIIISETRNNTIPYKSTVNQFLLLMQQSKYLLIFYLDVSKLIKKEFLIYLYMFTLKL